jgi:hypothetical protein
MGDVKVNEQAHIAIAQPDVGKQLRIMNWIHYLNAFDFDYDKFLNDQIDAVPEFNRSPS